MPVSFPVLLTRNLKCVFLKRERKEVANSRRILIMLEELSGLAMAGCLAKPPAFGVMNFSPNVRSVPWVGVLCSLGRSFPGPWVRP